MRQLELGDVLWVGRTTTGEEVVLDYVIERKIVTDLCASIMDGRYKGMFFFLAPANLLKNKNLGYGDLGLEIKFI